jgi:hypothetical protein
MLFEHPPQNALFACLLQGKFCFTNELKTPSEIVGPKSLPNFFLLQMDNYVKDNKNKYLLAFLSLLMEREVFEEVELGFLLVDHTHEDIDDVLDIVQKIKRTEQLYFGKFDEGFHGFTIKTFHSVVDTINSKF